MRDQLPAAAGAAWALGLAYLVPRVVQDPLVVRRTLGVLPSLPGWVHVLALVLLWTVACVVAGVLAVGRRSAKRAVRKFYRSQRDEFLDLARTTWAMRGALLFQYLAVGAIIGGGVVAWRAFCLGMNSESPLVVVLSGSMETAFYRGDLLFLTNWECKLCLGRKRQLPLCLFSPWKKSNREEANARVS